jgi:hypothetical protein
MRHALPVLAWASFAACAAAPHAVVFQSDFGRRDHAVAAMHGVAFGIEPRLALFEITHEIPPFDVWQAAWRLHAALPSWPPGTVFVSVVDPGVGTERAAVVARTRGGHWIVTPDNGTLTLVAGDLAEVRAIDAAAHRRPGSEASHTFHGRDLFAVVAARLAAGQLDFAAVGPPLGHDVVRIPMPEPELKDGVLCGFVTVHDGPFGNLWTNLGQDLLARVSLAPGIRLAVTIRERDRVAWQAVVPFARTFGDVPPGEPLAYLNSSGALALALNQGNFASQFAIGTGPDWKVAVSSGRE